MQPWRFIPVQDAKLRTRIHAAVEQERMATAHALGQREDEFMRLKVEGLQEAAEVIAVVLADGRQKHVFGRRTMPHMDLASAACAIQNLWIAARAEGLGMGWVSLFEPSENNRLLLLPAGAETVALLCLGPVAAFSERRMLEQQWASRQDLSTLVFNDGWARSTSLHAALAAAADETDKPG